MSLYFKPWTSITALSMLLSTACTGVEETPAAPAGVTSVRQAEAVFTVSVDGKDNAYQKLQAQIDGKTASTDEVAALVGGSTVASKEVYQQQDDTTEVLVDGAASTLTSKTVGFTGLSRVFSTSSSDVYACSTFVVQKSSVKLCILLTSPNSKPKQDPAMDAAIGQANEMNALMMDLVKRYPAPEQIDPDQFMQKESVQLQKIATLYCQASGLGVPCDPSQAKPGEPGTKQALATDWWYWIRQALSSVGVIPSVAGCPSNISLVQFYHDDEDHSNANSSWGWTGGIGLGSNTLYRFCKVPGVSFYPLAQKGTQYNYAVLQLGIFCPGGTSHYTQRFFDNEDSHNQNWTSGPTFPNLNLLGRNHLMFYCEFDAASSSPQMSGFPNLGFSYGLFAPSSMPSPLNLGSGYRYQDDEDIFNLDYWLNGPSNMMGGSSNTSMNLARVK